MPVTLPGVSTVIVDGYFNAADDQALNARRILVVAPANAETQNETPGYLLAEPTNELYNPTLYRTENDVVTDFGLGSPAHVAYSQVLRAGGTNIYISATAPHAAADAKPEPSGSYSTYTRREFEVIQALENVDLVLPELIVVVGYPINQFVTESGTDRVARYGEIAAQSCAALTAESFPCEAVFSVVDIETHLNANRTDPDGAGSDTARFASTYNPYKLTAANVNEYVGDLSKADLTSAANWHKGVPFPIQFALDAVEAASDPDGPSLSRFIVLPVGELVTTGQPADAASVVTFKTPEAAVCGHIFGTPFNGSITLKRFQNVRYIRYRLSKSNQKALIAVKACPINVDSQLFPITVDGVTAAQDKAGEVSHFTRLQTLTICNQLVRGSREICEVYIGKTADENTLNALETQLRSYYLDLKQMGAVRDIRFNIEFIYTQFKLNVNITVIPSGEIREIDLNVGIALQ